MGYDKTRIIIISKIKTKMVGTCLNGGEGTTSSDSTETSIIIMAISSC